ncbi:MAG: hypothetical protein HKM93_01570 [Desulfobacteraceae bacterium]|nr:hypothetical protein [Desulfobacteraceae bacterium]
MKTLIKNRGCRGIILVIAAIGVITLIGACGGGGGGGSDGSELQTGSFIDGPVAGLAYETDTQSGETNTDGNFFYFEGETVRFSVGDIEIGEAAGAATITPFDLAGLTPPTAAIEICRLVNQFYNANSPTLYNRVVNIAVFLQTLDEDGDAANGIVIPTGMHTLSTGVTLDFGQFFYEFTDDINFRRLLAAGRSDGLWGGTRAIRNPFYAIDALYAGLGLTPSIAAVSQIKYDDNANGTVDKIETITYDTNGSPTRYEEDSDANGTANSIYTYTYDANGNQIRDEEDSNANGTANSIYTNTYDANGNKTQQVYDSNANGTANSIYTNTYDANGNRIRREYDSDANGTANSVETYSYDTNGNKTRYEEDSDANGTANSIYTYTYDANGNRIRREYDSDANGTANSVETYSYDANGNQTGIEYDSDANGTPNKIEIYNYTNVNRWRVLFRFD